MSKSISILDKDYTQWVKKLVKRYRSSQIKAAVTVDVRNIYYSKKFYLLYHQCFTIFPQVVAELGNEDVPQVVAQIGN